MEDQMRKQLLLQIVNPLLGLAFLTLVVTLPFVASQDLWTAGMSRLHRLSGMVFAALAVIHIALNWTWIVNTFFRKKTGDK